MSARLFFGASPNFRRKHTASVVDGVNAVCLTTTARPRPLVRQGALFVFPENFAKGENKNPIFL